MPVVLIRILQIQIEVHRPAALRHQRVLGGVDRDPIQPCIERAVAAKRGQRPIRLEKRLLGDILGFGGIVHEAAHQLQHPMLVFQHQQVERRLVARLNAPDQFLVGVIRRGWSGRSSSARSCPAGGSALVDNATTALID